MVDKNTTTTVLEEVQQSSMTVNIALCPVHLTPDLVPPPPEMEHSLFTELILDSLTRDINPLYVLLSLPHEPPSPADKLTLL